MQDRRGRVRKLIVLCSVALLVLVSAVGWQSQPHAFAAPAPDCKPQADGPAQPDSVSCAAAEDSGAGSTQLRAPAPGSKNASSQPPADAAGVTTAGAGNSAKGSVASADALIEAQATTLEAPLLTCGSIQDGGWTTTSASFEVVRSCSITAPESGVAYITASSSLGVTTGGNYEARFNLNVDSTSGNASTDRWINAYTDSADGTDKNVDVSWLTPVSAGKHTFYFLGARYNGAGTVQLYDPSLSVVFFPGSNVDVLSCGVSGNTVWNTSETAFQSIRSCAINVPADGYIYLKGSASAGLSSGGSPYEGRFRVGVDAVTGTASSDRWVNVTTDSGDGTDEAVVTSLLTSVAAGPHTFYFSGTRYNGTGPLQLYDPSLSVLYFRPSSALVKVCGAGGSDVWTNSTTSYSVIRSCSLSAARSSVAFIEGTASAGLNDTGAGNDWEGQFRLGIDNDTGSSLFDRWVNVYTDSSDGTDRPVANSGVVNVGAGVHTYYFVGRRYAGNGTLRLYSPALTVLQLTPRVNVSVPIVRKP